MRLIHLWKERTQLKDEDGSQAQHIKEETGFDVLQFDFGRICLKFSIFVEACVQIDEDINEKDEHSGDIKYSVEKLFVLVFV